MAFTATLLLSQLECSWVLLEKSIEDAGPWKRDSAMPGVYNSVAGRKDLATQTFIPGAHRSGWNPAKRCEHPMPVSSWKGFQPLAKWFSWSRLSESEISCVCALSPLAFAYLRTPIDGVVYSTDASNSGGGVCESTGLTKLGWHRIRQPLAEGRLHELGTAYVFFEKSADMSAKVRWSYQLPTYVVLTSAGKKDSWLCLSCEPRKMPNICQIGCGHTVQASRLATRCHKNSTLELACSNLSALGLKTHINVIEARASLNCLQRRCRKTETLWSRFLLLTDSQVCTAILSKGKTSSKRMLPVIKKSNSLTLASRSMVFVVFCSSEDNPSDIPSRWRKVEFRSARKLFAESRENSSAR